MECSMGMARMAILYHNSSILIYQVIIYIIHIENLYKYLSLLNGSYDSAEIKEAIFKAY